MAAPVHHHQSGTITHLPSGHKSWYTTPNPFEHQFGYHRAIKRGPFIFVSGTTALKEIASRSPVANDTLSSSTTTPHKKSLQYNETEITHSPSTHPFLAEREKQSKVHHPTSAKLQAQIAMERCVDAVERLGGKREDVVRVKMFVAHHADCTDVGAAYRDCFGSKQSSQMDTGSGTATNEVGAVATMIVVQNGFVDADILVEVEVDAVVV